MKNWKTTVLGILGAGLLLATSKGWIDNDLSIFIGSVIVTLFGLASKDASNKEASETPIFGNRPNDR